MKTKLYISIISIFLLTSCFDEYEGTLPEGESWVYFKSGSVSVEENFDGPVTAQLVYAGPLRDSDITVTYSISDTELVVDEDYTVDSNTLTIPAGETEAEVVLLSSVIDDSFAEGNKSIKITLLETEGLGIGFPGPESASSSILINVLEDDFVVFGETSFEEPLAGENYVDPLGADNDHDLVNIVGLNSMDYDGSGSEMGFDAIFINTRDIGSGLDDNVGVTDNYDDGFTNGNQGYVLLDTDGTIQVTFEEVDVSAKERVFLSLDWFIQNSNYEGAVDADDTGNDIFRIYVIVDGIEEVSIVDVDGDGLEKAYNNSEAKEIFGTWDNLFVEIEGGASTAQLVIEVDTNSDGEGIAFDRIQFLGL